jgi:NitT/TauT family transport system substrate-binding protein
MTMIGENRPAPGGIIRRAAALLIVLAGPHLAPAADAETLRVGKSVPQAFGFVPVDIGTRNGIFKRNGLDIEITAFGGAPKLDQALAADAVDIGLNSGADMAFIVKGLPVKGVAAMANAPLELTLVVGPEGSIKSVSDLKGRRVAVSQLGSLTGWLVGELSRQQGWGPDGIERIAIGQVSAYWPAMQTKQVDGITIDLSSALQAERQGRGKLLVEFGDVVKDFHLYVIFATDKLIANRPETVRAFLRGWFETIAFMKDNKDVAVKIASEIQGVDADIAGRSFDTMMRSFSSDGRFNPKALSNLSRSFVDLNTLPAAPDMTALYTENFLP